MSEAANQSAVVLFIDGYLTRSGPMFGPGEMAAIDEEEACALFQRGAAVRIQDAAGYDYSEKKAVTRPPNKMMTETATITKG